MKRKRKRKARIQIEIPIDEEKRLRGSPRWMLVFKVSNESQPIVEVGTLDTVYEQFTRLSEQFTTFAFAVIYTPGSRIHRRWGKLKPQI